MDPISPIVPELRDREIIIAKDQPQYVPLPVLRGADQSGLVMARWTFTAEERHAIAHGADIFATQSTFGHKFQPLMFQVAFGLEPNSVKEFLAYDRADCRHLIITAAGDELKRQCVGCQKILVLCISCAVKRGSEYDVWHPEPVCE